MTSDRGHIATTSADSEESVLQELSEVAREVNRDILPFVNAAFSVSRRGLLARGGGLLASTLALSSPWLTVACKTPGTSGLKDATSDANNRKQQIGQGFAWLQGEVAKINADSSFTDLITNICKTPGLDVPPAVLGRLAALGAALRSGSATDADKQEFEALKALYATPHGKAMAVAIGGFLKANPYRMFEEIRKEGMVKSPVGAFDAGKKGVFLPLFGPAVIAKGKFVRAAILNHEIFNVPYGDEMWKAMIADPQYPYMVTKNVGGKDIKVKTVTLSTDDNTAYNPDKKFNEDVTIEGDLYPKSASDLGLIHHILDDCKKRAGAIRAGSSFNFATDFARTVPVFTNELYWGVLARFGNEKKNANLTGLLQKHGTLAPVTDHLSGKVPNYVAAAPNQTADDLKKAIITDEIKDFVEIEKSQTPSPDPTKVLWEVRINPDILKKFPIPTFEESYQHIKACFKNFFNNVAKEPVAMTAGIVSQKIYLTYILWLTHAYKEGGTVLSKQFSRHYSGDTVYKNYLTTNAIARKLKIQERNPGEPRFTDVRIAEHIFGIVVGAVAGQEEAACRVMQAMFNFQQGTIEAKDVSFDDFVGDCKTFVDTDKDYNEQRVPAFENLVKYTLEGIRLFPQGEVLLRRNNREFPVADFDSQLGQATISAETTVFVAHGSAMVDRDRDEMPDADMLVLGRNFNDGPTVFQKANLGKNEAYLSYGYGRHVCQGRYISSTIIACTMAAIFSRFPNAKAAKSLTAADKTTFAKNLGQGIFELDADNLYATKLTVQT
jgi:hypothetical protein